MDSLPSVTAAATPAPPALIADEERCCCSELAFVIDCLSYIWRQLLSWITCGCCYAESLEEELDVEQVDMQIHPPFIPPYYHHRDETLVKQCSLNISTLAEPFEVKVRITKCLYGGISVYLLTTDNHQLGSIEITEQRDEISTPYDDWITPLHFHLEFCPDVERIYPALKNNMIRTLFQAALEQLRPETIDHKYHVLILKHHPAGSKVSANSAQELNSLGMQQYTPIVAPDRFRGVTTYFYLTIDGARRWGRYIDKTPVFKEAINSPENLRGC